MALAAPARPRRRSLLPLLLAVAPALSAAPAPAAAQALQPFTVDDALALRGLRIEDLSPDGGMVATVVTTQRDRLGVDHFRFGDPTYTAPSTGELWVTDTRTGAAREVFPGRRVQVREPVWSPDGSTLAFFLLDGDRWGLRMWERASGRVREVRVRGDRPLASVSPLHWLPDGSGVAVGLREPGWEAVARGRFVAMTEGPIVVQSSQDDFLSWDAVRGLGALVVPAVVRVPSGDVTVLGEEAPVSDLVPSADGRFVSVVTSRPLRTSYERGQGTELSVRRVELATGAAVELMAPTEERRRLLWSQAGDAFAWANRGDVWVRRLEGDSAVKVTEGHRGPVSESDTTKLSFGAEGWRPDSGALLLSSRQGLHLLELGSGSLRLVHRVAEDEDARPREPLVGWSPDGAAVYLGYSARDRWERGLTRLDLATGDARPLVRSSDLFQGWTLSRDGSTVVYERSDGDRPEELHVAAADLSGERTLTDLNPWLRERALTRSELVSYLDVDGEKQNGILYYPVGWQPGTRYPLVAEIYEEFFDNGFNARMNLLAAEGWFGFRPSVDLEVGFPGEAWLKGVTAGINSLIERGLVDGERLGVHGTSYGGYATNLLITQTDRFDAAINISGKVNIISFLGDSEKITTRNYNAAEEGQDRLGATLWEQPQKYLEHTAVLAADRIETPLLLLTGEGDWNVPATNTREMYYALRRLGKEVVWVNYLRAGHGAGAAGTEEDFRDYWDRILGWYREKLAAEEKAAVTAGG